MAPPQVSPLAQIRALYDRLARAEALVAANKVHPVVNMPNHYIGEGNAGFYVVNGSCCCDDATNCVDLTKGHCKHRLAALLYAEQVVQAETPKASKPKAKANYNDSSPRAEELESKVAELYR
jgi:hypothetical protein